jgi:hypothetical protein
MDHALNNKPCDRVAARVIRPAQWYEKPPEAQVKPDPVEPPRLKTRKALVNGELETLYEKNSVETEQVLAAEHDIKNALKAKNELLEKAKQLDEVLSHISAQAHDEFNTALKFSKAALEDLRQVRMSLCSETKLIMTELADIKKFFLANDYQTEITRLGEFVDLVERLQEMKQQGTLDLIADIILKLSEKPRTAK